MNLPDASPFHSPRLSVDSLFEIQAPFNSQDQADLVLRSSDGFDFYVLKAILTFASPTFSDLITLPRPPFTSPEAEDYYYELKNGFRVVVFHESTAPVLDILLRILYPLQAPDLDDVWLLGEVARIAEKYAMDYVLEEINRLLQKRSQVPNPPVQHHIHIFMIASEFNLREAACVAAIESLKHPVSGYFFPALNQMRAGSAGALARLVDFRTNVVIAVFQLCRPDLHLNPVFLHRITRLYECPRTGDGCGGEDYTLFLNVKKAKSAFWAKLLDAIQPEILIAPLSQKVMSIPVIIKAAAGLACNACRTRILSSAVSIDKTFRDEMLFIASKTMKRVGIAKDECIHSREEYNVARCTTPDSTYEDKYDYETYDDDDKDSTRCQW